MIPNPILLNIVLLSVTYYWSNTCSSGWSINLLQGFKTFMDHQFYGSCTMDPLNCSDVPMTGNSFHGLALLRVSYAKCKSLATSRRHFYQDSNKLLTKIYIHSVKGSLCVYLKPWSLIDTPSIQLLFINLYYMISLHTSKTTKNLPLFLLYLSYN